MKLAQSLPNKFSACNAMLWALDGSIVMCNKINALYDMQSLVFL